jgi:hypothetical protein
MDVITTPLWSNIGSPMFTSGLFMDSATDLIGITFRADRTGTIKKIGWATNTVTVSDTLRIALQDTTALGVPDGVDDDSVTRGSLTSNTGYLETFATGKTISSIYQQVAVVFAFDSYVSGNLKIAGLSGQTRPQMINSQYNCPGPSGTYSKSISDVPVLYVEYSDGTALRTPGLFPLATSGVNNYNTGSSPDEFGCRFAMPFTAECAGVAVPWWGNNGAEGTFTLYDADESTVLASRNYDEDLSLENGGLTGTAYWTQGPVRLLGGVPYIFTVKPTNTVNTSYREHTLIHADVRKAIGFGTTLEGVSRTNEGDWDAASTTVIHNFALLLTGMETRARRAQPWSQQRGFERRRR